MKNIQYSTVLEALASQEDVAVKSVFADLKSHIEVVQGKFP